MSTKNASLLIAPPPGTLAWVLLELPKFTELSPQARQNMGSAIRRFCDVLERSSDRIAADLKALETLFDRASPGAQRLSPARWRNIKSDVRRAVKLTGADRPAPDAKVPLTDAWEALCQSGTNPSERAVLRRLGRYCCTRQIGPKQVTDQIMGNFAQYLDERVLSRDPQRTFGDTVRAWNRKVAGGELAHLTATNRSRAYTLQWEDFPASLKQDVDAWHEICLRPDPVRSGCAGAGQSVDDRAAEPDDPPAGDPRLSCKAEDAEKLDGLGPLITPERVKNGLNFFLDRNDGKPSVQAHGMARLAVTIARHWLKLDEEGIRKLRGWARKLQPKRRGLTKKSEDRLRQFRDEKVLRALFTLPDKILAEEFRKAPDSRSALRVQTALAIRPSFRWLRCGSKIFGPWTSTFTSSERFQKKTPCCKSASMQKTSRMTSTSPSPFPMRSAISSIHTWPGINRCWRTGMLPRFCSPASRAHRRAPIPCVETSPERFEENWVCTYTRTFSDNIAALMFLGRHPGHYEDVRRILHHKNIQTTLDSYAGLEAVTALRRYDDIVLDLKEKAA